MISLPDTFFLSRVSVPFSFFFNSPPTAAKKEKEFFGDTPNPGKGLCPLHSQKLSGREICMIGPSHGGVLYLRQGRAQARKNEWIILAGSNIDAIGIIILQ